MSRDEKEFLNKLIKIFKVEAKEHTESAVAQLLKLEKLDSNEDAAELTEVLFRETHSLKGAARSVDFMDIESICQNLESIFRHLKQNYFKPSKEFFDFILSTFDLLDELIGEAKVERELINAINEQLRGIYEEISANNQTELNIKPINKLLQSEEIQPDEIVEDNQDDKLKSKLKKLSKRKKAKEKVKQSSEQQPEIVDKNKTAKQNKPEKTELKEQFIRMSVERLNSLMLKLEDTLTIKLTEANALSELEDAVNFLAIKKKEFRKLLNKGALQSARFNHLQEDGDGADQLSIGEWTTDFIKEFEASIFSKYNRQKNVFRQNADKIDETIEELRKVLLLPFSTVLDLFPKMVRDLATSEEKKINCEISGEDVEIDKRILDLLKDPLIHLVRNSVDHGIEIPAERVKNNKPETGELKISVTSEAGNNIRVMIEDDGQGIDPDLVYERAMQSSIIDDSEELTDSEKLNLIFSSGFTTSTVITDLSGRGLGLAIVKEKVDNLGGSIKIKTKKGEGTQFIIDLPSSRATFRGIITEINKRYFVFPTASVERVIRISRDEIKTVESKRVIFQNKVAVPVFKLTDLLQLPDDKRNKESEKSLSVVLVGKENTIGVIVDQIVREQELMLKGLGKQLKNVNNVMGASILGDGRVATVLYLPNLVKKAETTTGDSLSISDKKQQKDKAKILIAEDSITSRMLLVNILETAGYDVTSAIDGSEAYSILKSERFDLVVSDVDMPNMNGFELTKRIRQDDKLKDLPLILVTALKSRADKERGMDVGANAYIVKSSFKPETLLNTIKKFV